MEKITRLIRSLNETHRICTHDISGHLHLLRFCIDEFSDQLKDSNPLIQKIDEAIGKLEDMNKQWKISTRYHDPNLKIGPESIAEKSHGLINLYYGKFVPNIEYQLNGSEAVDFEKGTLIVELIFAFCSIVCQFAVVYEMRSLNFVIDLNKISENRLELKIKSRVHLEKEFIEKIVSKGDENDRTLRRFIAIESLKECGGQYEFDYNDSGYSVRITV